MASLLIQPRWRTRLDPTPERVDPGTEPMVELPLLGRISAGHPLEAIEDPEPVQVPQRFAARAAFALRVQGDSMRDEQIEEGDLVLIAPRSTVDDGETVVALIDDGGAVLKRLYREPAGLRLQPANPDHAPMLRPFGAVEVVGVVTAVVRVID